MRFVGQLGDERKAVRNFVTNLIVIKFACF